MIVSVVVAMGENRVIGKDGGLPWHIPGDLKLFKQTTMGKPILMGRKTWQSIGRPLPGRDNIVITRKHDYQAEGAQVAGSLEQALKIAESLGTEEAMVIGGAEIYALALPRADRLYLTEVALSPDGDAYFPTIDKNDWQQTSDQAFAAEGDAPAYTLRVYDRKAG